jgi:hypothetical protein
MTTPVTSRTVSAGRGWTWILEGVHLFKKNPVMLIILLVIVFVISLILGRVPFVGIFATYILGPIFGAGLMLGCRDLDKGQDLEINHLFSGFKQHTKPLLLLGLFYLIAVVAAVALMTGLTDLQSINTVLAGEQLPEGQQMQTSMLRVLTGLALLLPVIAAYTFAPALVVLDAQEAVPALKASIVATIKNVLPFLVYSIGIFALVIPLILSGTVAMMLTRSTVVMYGVMFIALLILMPVVMCSFYTSYKDIFNQNAA